MNYEFAKKITNIIRFVDDLIIINHENEFENLFNDVCSPNVI